MKKWKHSFIYSLYVFVVLPLVVILPFSVFSTMYFTNFYEDTIQQRYADRLESIYTKHELHLESITRNVNFLEGDSKFIDLMRGNDNDANSRHVREQLKLFENKYPLIASAYILDQSNSMVYASGASYGVSDFFDSVHHYEDYDASYWFDYRNPLSEKRIVPPSYADVFGKKLMVLPIVYSKIGDAYTNNLLIINVSLDYIFEEMTKNNVELSPINGMVSRYTGDWYGGDGFRQKVEGDFIKKMMTNGLSVFDYKLNGEKYMFVSYCPNHSVLGYAYVAGIPRDVISNRVYKVIWVLVFAWALIFLISFIAIRFSVKNLYAPIRGILDLVYQDEDCDNASDKGDLAYIRNYIHHSMKLKENYLPIVKEKLLMEFLDADETDESEFAAKFNENDLIFKKSAFRIVFWRLRPTAQYYKQYPQITYENMTKKLLDVLIPCFPESYDIYSISVSTEAICLVLNVNDGTTEKDIDIAFNKFTEYLAADKEIIQMRVSVGGEYPGLMGMRKSYKEAQSSFEGLTEVVSGTDSITNRRKPVILGEAEENALTNYLLAGQISTARKFINELIATAKEKRNSGSFIHNLYIRLSNCILNVMRLRNIPFDGRRVDEIDITARFYNLPPEELSAEIEKMLDVIEGKLSVNKIKVEDIINDIQQHYTEDMRLDELADKYHTSPSYLSRVLKQSLGVTFVDYLSRLRVQRAKELLEKTDKSVSEIAELSGFVNPSGFTRVFKAHIGISPSQYRKTIN